MEAMHLLRTQTVALAQRTRLALIVLDKLVGAKIDGQATSCGLGLQAVHQFVQCEAHVQDRRLSLSRNRQMVLLDMWKISGSQQNNHLPLMNRSKYIIFVTVLPHISADKTEWMVFFWAKQLFCPGIGEF